MNELTITIDNVIRDMILRKIQYEKFLNFLEDRNYMGVFDSYIVANGEVVKLLKQYEYFNSKYNSYFNGKYNSE